MSTAHELERTIQQILQQGRGILAADESTGTIGKRFASVGVENSEEHRRAYRDLLFSAPGMSATISGVIMYEETLGQKSADGTPFPEMLERMGTVPGIKVDKGTVALPGAASGELVTTGLDGLPERVAAFRARGARFAKWRAVIEIGAGKPSTACIEANAHALARYAGICQAAGVVPIVEPEVLMDGEHTRARCGEVTEAVLHAVFSALREQNVAPEHIRLKPNMVIAGAKCPQQAGPAEVAEATLACFRRVVPAAVPGIVFLSGGQGDVQATENLAAIRALGRAPWPGGEASEGTARPMASGASTGGSADGAGGSAGGGNGAGASGCPGGGTCGGGRSLSPEGEPLPLEATARRSLFERLAASDPGDVSRRAGRPGPRAAG
ncbi:MAG: class I fructose-bisphosphate aldolase, partial [Planctomycetia bacterium]